MSIEIRMKWEEQLTKPSTIEGVVDLLVQIKCSLAAWDTAKKGG
jgi:hypothetical protein